MVIVTKHIFLYILLLFLIVIFCYNNEHFTETNFYNLKESIKIMTDKKYFNHFNKYDFKLRNLQDLQDCKKIYSKNTLTYSEKEKNELNKFVKKVRNTKYKKIFDNIKFIKVKDSIESGLPHTRGSAIVFSQKWIDMKFKTPEEYKRMEDYFLHGIEQTPISSPFYARGHRYWYNFILMKQFDIDHPNDNNRQRKIRRVQV